ncbi:MAG: DNA-binding response regulator [Actinobacteria bacterium HGW-Actinobacteria-1]|nr:MAG: DNA-binding response regulator [Actinobacteria bacterium HGW-Actinobacteria-1]
MRGRILVVDDDAAIREVVRLNLEAEGYDVTSAESVERARAAFSGGRFDMAILDVMLPDGDGFELARALRESSDLPIMMLSARDTDVDKAVGLGVGADDYLTKPFSPLELVARVKAHLRRYTATAPHGSVAHGQLLEAGPIAIDVLRRSVAVRGVNVELTATEFDILRMLVEQPMRVFTKAQIYERVWGTESFGDLSTVQVHVRRLRTKIEEHPEEPRLVTTVWGIGYRFEGGS